MGVAHTPQADTNTPRLKTVAAAKYVIVCCVRRTLVHQSLNVFEACLFAIKLLSLFPVGCARIGVYRKGAADKLSDVCCEVSMAVTFNIVYFFVVKSCIFS
jgi:hypothetical protein